MIRILSGRSPAFAALVLAAALCASSGCGKRTEKAQSGAEKSSRVHVDAAVAKIGSVAPDFTLVRHGSDSTVTLSSLRGKVVLLNFWGSWCGPCRMELPALVSFYRTHEDSVVVLGVLDNHTPMDDKGAGVLISRLGIDYPNVVGVPAVFKAYEVEGFPTTYIIDRTGVIRQRLVGMRSGPVFEREFENVLHG